MQPSSDQQLGAQLRQRAQAGLASRQTLAAVVRDLLGADQALLAPLLHLVGQPGFQRLDASLSPGLRLLARDALLQELQDTYQPRVVARLRDVLDGYLDLVDASSGLHVSLPPTELQAPPAPEVVAPAPAPAISPVDSSAHGSAAGAGFSSSSSATSSAAFNAVSSAVPTASGGVDASLIGLPPLSSAPPAGAAAAVPPDPWASVPRPSVPAVASAPSAGVTGSSSAQAGVPLDSVASSLGASPAPVSGPTVAPSAMSAAASVSASIPGPGAGAASAAPVSAAAVSSPAGAATPVASAPPAASPSMAPAPAAATAAPGAPASPEPPRRILPVLAAGVAGLVIALVFGVVLRSPQLCGLMGSCAAAPASSRGISASEQALRAGEAAIRALAAATDLAIYRQALSTLDTQLLRLSGDRLDPAQQRRLVQLQAQSRQGQARLNQEAADADRVQKAAADIDALPSQPPAEVEANRAQIRRSLLAIPARSFSHSEAQTQLKRLDAAPAPVAPATPEPAGPSPAPESSAPPAAAPAPAPSPAPAPRSRPGGWTGGGSSRSGGGGWTGGGAGGAGAGGGWSPPARSVPAPAPQDDGERNAPYRSEPLF